MSNTLGTSFRVTSFGESHGPCIGVVIDGCPAGLRIDAAQIQADLERRRPGQALSTPRNETDRLLFLSGLHKGITTGAPITGLVWNEDVQSAGYEKRRFTPRPGHADFTAFMKYGGHNDPRGGGRFSARITAGWVIAGGIAKQLLEKIGIEILAFTKSIGGIETPEKISDAVIRKEMEKSPTRAPHKATAKKMETLLQRLAKQGETVGGVIEGRGLHLPVGLGEPLFDTLDGELAKALFALPAVKGVAFGSGWASSLQTGSRYNDPLRVRNGKVISPTNHAGGILGGLSSGMPLIVQVAFKPIASIRSKQKTVDLKSNQNTTLVTEGRFDPCPVPRGVPLVEAMLAIVLCDFALRGSFLPQKFR